MSCDAEYMMRRAGQSARHMEIGAALVEYVVIAALIIVVGAVSVSNAGVQAADKINTVANLLESSGTDTTPPPPAPGTWCYSDDARTDRYFVSWEETIGSKNATEIPNFYFYRRFDLSSISIPDNIVSIGNSAFAGCTELESVYMPDTVTYMSGHAFAYCAALSEINLSSQITEIYGGTFRNCESLQSIYLPDNIISIGEYAFGKCSGLVYLYLPKSLEILGDSCFENCSSLNEITIPESVNSIEIDALRNCKNLHTINYEGDSTQWAEISKGDNWHYNVPACCVHCIRDNVDEPI